MLNDAVVCLGKYWKRSRVWALGTLEICDFSNSREFFEKLCELFASANYTDFVKIADGLLKMLVTQSEDRLYVDLFTFLCERFPHSFALAVISNN
jgi:hypothetical protein